MGIENEDMDMPMMEEQLPADPDHIESAEDARLMVDYYKKRVEINADPADEAALAHFEEVLAKLEDFKEPEEHIAA